MKWGELKKLIDAEVKDDEEICLIDLSAWGNKGISIERETDGVYIYSGRYGYDLYIHSSSKHYTQTAKPDKD